MAKRITAAAKRARERFIYDKLTGELRYRHDVMSGRNHAHVRMKAGDIAGSVNPDTGYRFVYFEGRRVTAGRLIWLIVMGVWPPREVDHENTRKADNRWHNLRLATRAQQCQNRRCKSDSRSGFKGVHLRKDGRYHVQITASLGVHDDVDHARGVYARAAKALHRAFANTTPKRRTPVWRRAAEGGAFAR